MQITLDDISNAIREAVITTPVKRRVMIDNMDSVLKPQQKSVVEECLLKGNGGMSIPMGEGKTRTSIVLGLELRKRLGKKTPVLAVMKKSLIGEWEKEVDLCFGDALKVLVLHPSYIKNLDEKILPINDYDLVLTTVDTLGKYYRKGLVESLFVEKIIENEGMFGQHLINLYNTPINPLLSIPNSGFVLYSTFWSCLIVDEVQLYTNIETDYCRSIGALCAHHRWALSGTMFNEPKASKMLGYFVIIGDQYFPRTLPLAQVAIRSREFTGYARTLVERRKDTLTYTIPPIHEITITHNLSKEEEKLYVSIRGVMQNIKKEHQKYKQARDVGHMREFGSYLLATLTYLRQLIVCPLLPLAKVALDSTSLSSKSKLSQMLSQNTKELGLEEWLSNPQSIYSSRVKEALKTLDSHPKARIVVFTCFRTVLNLMMHCEKENLMSSRPHFTVEGSDSIKKRKETMTAFSKSDNGILFLTYDIGAEGLNLQSAAVALIVDYWWNDGKTQQAMARIARQGQMNPAIHIYYFTSNTQVENAILHKHADKLSILNDLRSGSTNKKINKLSLEDIVKIITSTEVYATLKLVRDIKAM